MEELYKIKAEILRYAFEYLKKYAESANNDEKKITALKSLGELARQVAKNA